MKPTLSGSQSFMGHHQHGNRVSPSFELMTQSTRATSSPHHSRNFNESRFMFPAPYVRNDSERYLCNSRGPGGTYELPERAFRGYNNPEVLSNSGGYIPPGTHSVPAGLFQMNLHPHTSRSEDEHQFLPPLRPRPTFTNYSYEEMDRCFWDEDPHFPLSSSSLPRIPSQGDIMEFSGGYSQSYLGDEGVLKMQKYNERLASFPELPMEAHNRIFQMGNDIVDCFEVHLERFFRGSLLDSAANCHAVFTKKERTGQRWLMVFKEDINRSVVKFNRLLTHSLLVRIQSSVAIEIEAGRAHYDPPAEMCVLNFRNEEGASRFHKTLHESQTTAWNHREVTEEQRVKSLLFSRFNNAPRADVGRGPESHFATAVPQPRSPFTLGSMRDSFDISSPIQMTPMSPSVRMSDMDQNWRSRGGLGAQEDPTYMGESPISKRNRACPSSPLAVNENKSIYDSMTHKNAMKLDGSGDAGGSSLEFKEETSFECSDVTLFMKRNCGVPCYTELGKGKLRVVDHGTSALDEIIFTGEEERDGIYSQFIFRWNSVTKEESEGGNVTCKWDGTASFNKAPNQLPDINQFKVDLKDKDMSDMFIAAFQKGVERGCDAAVRKRHVIWFVKNRGHSFNK